MGGEACVQYQINIDKPVDSLEGHPQSVMNDVRFKEWDDQTVSPNLCTRIRIESSTGKNVRRLSDEAWQARWRGTVPEVGAKRALNRKLSACINWVYSLPSA